MDFDLNGENTMKIGKDKHFEYVDKVLKSLDNLTNLVKYSEHNYSLAKLKKYAEGLFDRAPFKPGDRVRLIKTPQIDEKHSWGYLGSKHFLVEGALATVHEVDFSDGLFEAWLYFDNETWISSVDKQKHKPETPGLYHFWETYLEKVEEKDEQKNY